MADMLIITAAVIGALTVIFCGVAVIVMEAVRRLVGIWWKLRDAVKARKGSEQASKEE